MPIGKNAIKRITNNGYSSVKSSAPDMENSEIAEKKAETIEEKAPTAKKATAKRTTSATAPKASAPKASAPKKPSAKKAPSAPKKSMESEPELSPVKTAKKVVKKAPSKAKAQDNGCINIGRGELPVHLL